MKIGSIVIRCYEFDKMVRFWKGALHYITTEPIENGWIILRDPLKHGPNISLDKIDTKRTGKRCRLHLDLYAEDQEAEVNRLISLGASQYPWSMGLMTPIMSFWRIQTETFSVLCKYNRLLDTYRLFAFS